MKIPLILATAVSFPLTLQALNLSEQTVGVSKPSTANRPQPTRSLAPASSSSPVGQPTKAVVKPKVDAQARKDSSKESSQAKQSPQETLVTRDSSPLERVSNTADSAELRDEPNLQQADAETERDRSVSQNGLAQLPEGPFATNLSQTSSPSFFHVGTANSILQPIGAALQPSPQNDSNTIHNELNGLSESSPLTQKPLMASSLQSPSSLLSTPGSAIQPGETLSQTHRDQAAGVRQNTSTYLTEAVPVSHAPLVARFPQLPSSAPAQRSTAAASTEPMVKLSLQQALSKARQSSLEVQVTSDQVAQAKTALNKAKAALWPELNLKLEVSGSDSSLDILENRAEADLGESSANEFETSLSAPTATATGELELTYDLYTGGERSAEIKQARELLYQAQLELVSQTLKTENEVASAYYDLQEAAEQVRIAQQSITHSQSLLESSDALLRVGRATKADVLKAEVKVANAQQTLMTAKGKEKVAQSKLVEFLDLEGSTKIAATDPIAPVAAWTSSLEASIAEALENRPEPREQLAQKRIEETNRTIAKSQLKPTVGLYAELESTKVLVPGLSELRNLDEQGIGVGWAAGITMDWTLFDGFSARSQARKAKIGMEIAEKNYASARNSIRQEVQQAFASLETSHQNMTTALSAMKSAEESLEATRIRFRTGFGDQLNVVSAVDDLSQAQLNYSSAILEYNRAIISLENATNRRLAKTSLLTKKEG